jgi:excinuclease ABC subunit A
MLPVRLRGARIHNLRGIDLDLEPGTFIAITGPSGAGKSSLALDTLHAEGQRRFVESFSPYARQFLERRERPPFDSLEPIAATVAVDRKSQVKSSRSTLATLADLEAYFAALFAKVSRPMCAACNRYAEDRSPQEIAEELVAKHPGARVRIEFPLHVDGDAGRYLELRDRLVADGWRRVVTRNGSPGIQQGATAGAALYDLDELRPSDAVARDADLALVVDRLVLKASELPRIIQALEAAWGVKSAPYIDKGTVRVVFVDREAFSDPASRRAERNASSDPSERAACRQLVERGLACPSCATRFERPRPGFFSYDSPLGACPTCRGFGRSIGVDWSKVIPDGSRTLTGGAIKAWMGKSAEWEREQLEKVCVKYSIPMDVAWDRLSTKQKGLIIDGDGKFAGVRGWFSWLETRTYKMHVRVFLARYREYLPCATCGGARLRPEARIYKVADRDLPSFHAATVAEAHALVAALTPTDGQARLVCEELRARLGYLEAVGLGYLTLDRQARTLSGGETQRAALTTALGSKLAGALFVLDEPTVGLHAADIPALTTAIRGLVHGGNTVIVVEHDRAVISQADRVIELGPGAGTSGGQLLFDGTPSALAERLDTPTGGAWSSTKRATRKRKRKDAADGTVPGVLRLTEVRTHNLNVDEISIPLGAFVALVGPSGSGKSTLAEDVVVGRLAPLLARRTEAEKAEKKAKKNGTSGETHAWEEGDCQGWGDLRDVVLVDQSPLGRTARGNAATYTKAWNRLRERFASEPDAIRRGFTTATFSFNVRGEGGASGRCDACDGEGSETVEMQFLADVTFECPVCHGKRFQADVLAIKHEGLDVSEVLSLTADEALSRLVVTSDGKKDYVLERALTPLIRVGLGYLPLGQPLATLSGGEAQRLKLARALAEKPRGTLFVVDEPSAGLHALDAAHVIEALHTLVDEGGSVLVVEHDLSVIEAADHVIELGPGGGPQGGSLLFEGSVTDLAKAKTKTGAALRASRAPQSMTVHQAANAPKAPPAIVVTRAREHTLKDVSCMVPHGKLTVFTGPSGSGKSSLAFDVIFAEGQRRFLDTLSPYARQFLPTLPRPDVDAVIGVPPSIALEQRTSRGGAHSTVATVTEVGHYLRLLWAKLGTIHCPKCGSQVAALSSEELRNAVHKRGELDDSKANYTIYAPAVRSRKGTYLDLFTQASRAGIRTARVDGALVEIEPPPRLAKTKEHDIDLILHYGPLATVSDAILDRALMFGDGAIRLHEGGPTKSGETDEILSTRRACLACGTGVPELDPRWFSWNTAQGRCPTCEGTGLKNAGEAPEDLTPCGSCKGTRLAPIPRGVTLFGESYPDFNRRDIAGALLAAQAFVFSGERASEIADAPVRELLRRLTFLAEIGLGYLQLDRPASTLSGGELQRLRLAAQLGSGLTGALYVLDEPTIGLHPRDTHRLLANLKRLVATGSTVMVVEHDEAVIRAADHIIDVGPRGGRDGGRILVEGTVDDLLATPQSLTARALSGGASEGSLMKTVAEAAPPSRGHLTLRGARGHNLKGVDVSFPLGAMTVIAGVSGSGKSTLVRQVLLPALRKKLGLVADEPLPFDALELPSDSKVTRALLVDQAPIGRSPRSVPATFLGIFDELRKLWASMPEAKVRGYTTARFSFNTGKGRCETCEGQGVVVSEMSFLPDVVSVCPACRGLRYEPETASVLFQGRSIGDALRLSAKEAIPLFAHHPKIRRPLEMMVELGVGYIQLGQGSHTLSGGEAQRLKLAAELAEGARHEPTVYVLDEPTTGLHLDDVRRLIRVLGRLVARGDTLLIVEHHLDLIAAGDLVVELGPEAGRDGGTLVFSGTPAELAQAATATGEALRTNEAGKHAPRVTAPVSSASPPAAAAKKGRTKKLS